MTQSGPGQTYNLHMTANEKIPWKRFSVEAAAIVASILLAFAIDAWWDRSQEERRLYAILEVLETGFTEHLQLVSRNLDVATANRDLLKSFVNMSPDETQQISAERRDSILGAILQPNTFILNINFLLTMLDDESIKLLDNSALRQAVADWQSWIDELQERRAMLVISESAGLQELSRRQEMWPYLTLGPRRDTPAMSDDLIRGIREDQVVMALVVQKAYSASLHLLDLRNLQNRAQAVLDFLRSELAN